MKSKIIAVIVKYKTPVKKIPGVETIVIDNSPPNKNLGFAAAVNIGIKKALAGGADKILLVNPDIKIKKIDFKNGDVVAPVLKFKRDGEWVYDHGGRVNWLIGRTTHIESPGEIDYVSGACMMIDKKVFAKIGFFDERFFMYFEDVDFCLRAKQAGFKISISNTTVIHNLTKDPTRIDYAIISNKKFILKWIPLPNKILGLLYLLALFLKSTARMAPETLETKAL
jgi:GT2 family glycosyltransferase